MGSRTAGNEKAVAWVAATGAGASEGTFADAAAWGEVVVNATGGLVSIDALTAAGADNLAGKVLLDISNPLDFSEGFPPKVAQPDGRSLGELIQATFPEARVVKTLNTMNADVMVHPRSLPGSHSVFVAGDDRRREGARARTCCAASAGRATRSSTPAASAPRAASSSTCRCGSASWAASARPSFNVSVVRA